jgi:redox-sensitive bicupin YhaK (pirin superfamily)
MIALLIHSRERDLGGFSVRRILPYATHRMVGPFLFFDHMGPADFPPGQGIEVRPHPHIHLATVTYLFEGAIRHRDSLGSDQLIEPGAINWMTAGRGIVHSERAPEEFLRTGGRLNGIQVWVALPEGAENGEPAFTHLPAASLPSWDEGGARLRLLVGQAFGRASPAPVHSDLFYLEALLPAGARLRFPTDGREAAFYLAEGAVQAYGKTIAPFTMGVAAKDAETIELEALSPSRVMLLGGKPVGDRYIFWNFVSSSEAEIARAAREWKPGPGEKGSRFPKIPGDADDYIPLPPEPPPNPEGTIL